jgi:Tfp pilus assembly protein PilW
MCGFVSALSAAENTLIERSGTIDSYNRKNATLTIDDMTFFVDNAVVIKNSKGVSTTSFQLTKGTKVNFGFRMNERNKYPSIGGTIVSIRLR